MNEPSLLRRTCWRCDMQGVTLVNDPMMPVRDPIGVCRSCANERRIIANRNRVLGSDIVIDPRADWTSIR